jgi:hypothetical protein
VISKFVCNKYGLCEEFMIEDEVFDKFFSTLEKVKIFRTTITTLITILVMLLMF